jgi:dihydrofolate synthase/folylpolyglutamate synthase
MLPARIETLADLEGLLARTTNYEEKAPRGDLDRAFDLSRMRALLAAVGDPQRGPETFHVAGSKGKGSVARMVDAAWRAAGRGPVGLYTSPHLESLVERVEVDGEPVSGTELAAAASALLPRLRATEGTSGFPTFFEILTAAAHVAFRARGVKSAVLEVGLGGRLDATTVCEPRVTAVTSVELEHAALLGPTVEAIAREKAGIVMPGVPCVSGLVPGSGPARVLEEVARAAGARLVRIGTEATLDEAWTGPGPVARAVVSGPDGAPPLLAVMPVAGLHQARNAAVAVVACRLLGIPDAAISRGLASLSLPARMELLRRRPDVVVDGAHTPASARAAAEAAAGCFPAARTHLVLGVLAEKDVAGILDALAPLASSVVACGVPSPRALAPDALAEAARARIRGPVETAPDAASGLAKALARAAPDDLVLVTGSLYHAGAARAALR